MEKLRLVAYVKHLRYKHFQFTWSIPWWQWAAVRNETYKPCLHDKCHMLCHLLNAKEAQNEDMRRSKQKWNNCWQPLARTQEWNSENAFSIIAKQFTCFAILIRILQRKKWLDYVFNQLWIAECSKAITKTSCKWISQIRWILLFVFCALSVQYVFKIRKTKC